MTAPLLFVACFMFLASVLLLGVIYSRTHWLAKALLVSSSLVFSAFFYIAYVASLGYPTMAQPPELFRYISSVVREPYPAKDDPGAIYVWLTTDDVVPRAIALPYSTETRRLMAMAKKRTAEGETVYMGKQKPTRTGATGSSLNKEGDKSTGTNMLPYHIEGTPIEIKPAPDTLPKKGTNQ
jgi:hypothetical protein